MTRTQRWFGRLCWWCGIEFYRDERVVGVNEYGYVHYELSPGLHAKIELPRVARWAERLFALDRPHAV